MNFSGIGEEAVACGLRYIVWTSSLIKLAYRSPIRIFQEYDFEMRIAKNRARSLGM